MSTQDVALRIDIGVRDQRRPVDLATGELLAPRLKIATPEKSTPNAVAAIVDEIANSSPTSCPAPIGVTIPGVVQHGSCGPPRISTSLDRRRR